MIILVFILSLSLQLKAQSLESGSAVAGSIGLSGALKTLIIPKGWPIGAIASTYGYEVWNIPSDLRIDQNNKAIFCINSVELISETSILGISFGGEASRTFKVGRCHERDFAEGDDLILATTMEFGIGSKSMPIGISLALGINFEGFHQHMVNHFRYNNHHKKSNAHRMRRLMKHIAFFLAKKNLQKQMNTIDKIYAKLFFFPLYFLSDKSKETSTIASFSKADLDYLKKVIEGKQDAIQDHVFNSLEFMRRSADFYTCLSKTECDETLVDFLVFYEALSKNFEDCHGLDINGSLKSNFSLDLLSDMKVDFSVGATRTNLARYTESSLNNSLLATKEFLTHNFKKRPPACQEVSKMGAENFVRFYTLFFD